ncbi:MAG: polymer-forming cytoskeletal protein [Chloroflexi bacterium]|nr:MAG: polymer-forming cytoskeletal protein [Chloroflexota bacterium]
MRTSTRLLIIFVIFGALVVIGRVIQANFFPDVDVTSEGIMIVENYDLQSTQEDDLVVLGDTVRIGDDGRVTGDTALIGQTVDVAGRIDGDLTALGETIHIQPGSTIMGAATLIGDSVTVEGNIVGNITVMGDSVRLNREARLSENIIACASTLDDTRTGDVAAVLPCHDGENLRMLEIIAPFYENGQFNFPDIGLDVQVAGLGTFTLLLSLLTALMFTAFSVLIVAIFPRHINYIEEAVATTPRRLVILGVLTFALAWGIVIAYIILLAAVPTIGLILLPVILLAALIFFGMIVAGWITIMLYIGDWLLQRLTGTILPPLVATAVGSIGLFVLWHIILLVPLGFLVNLAALVIIGSIGLGATVLTRLGTRPLSRKTAFVQG